MHVHGPTKYSKLCEECYFLLKFFTLSGGQLSQFALDLNPAQVNEAENASFTVSFSNFASAPLGPGEFVIVTVTVTAQRAQRNIGENI